VSQYSSSSLRWGGSAQEQEARPAHATHSVEALDVGNVLVDEEAHVGGHVAGAAACAAWARNQSHEGGRVVDSRECLGNGSGGGGRGRVWR
jgi:hypothetical protein